MRQFRLSAYDTLGYLATGYALLFLLDYVAGCRILLNPDPSFPPLGGTAFVAVLSYVVGHVVAHFSRHLIERLIVEKRYAPRELDLFSDNSRLNWSKVARLSDETRCRIRKRLDEKGIRTTGRDLFSRLDIIVKRSQLVADRLNGFLVLYGFCRNMTLVLGFSGVVFLGKGVHELCTSGVQSGDFWIVASLTLGVGSWVMWDRYMKFYCAYTTTVFGVFAEEEETGKQSSE